MVTLTIQPSGAIPVTHVLKDETITIGRMSGNTIVVNDSSVSLMHAKITRKDGQFFLKDLNSTNGTRVNGQAITEARLRDRDTIRFADVSGQFTEEAAEATSVPAPAPVPVARISEIQPAPPVSQPVPALAPQRPVPAKRKPLIPTLAAVAGGVVALGVVSFVVWNLTHQGNAKGESAAAPAKPAVVQTASVVPHPATTAVAPAPATTSDATNGAPPDVPTLIKTLQDPDPAERRQAVAALHSMGPDAANATPALHQALSDPDQEVRLWAALALINIKSYDKAIPPILLHVLHDEKPMVRQLACVSLGLLPYEQSEKETVVPALVAAANTDSDEDVRKAAVAALEVIDPDLPPKTLTK